MLQICFLGKWDFITKSREYDKEDNQVKWESAKETKEDQSTE